MVNSKRRYTIFAILVAAAVSVTAWMLLRADVGSDRDRARDRALQEFLVKTDREFRSTDEPWLREAVSEGEAINQSQVLTVAGIVRLQALLERMYPKQLPNDDGNGQYTPEIALIHRQHVFAAMVSAGLSDRLRFDRRVASDVLRAAAKVFIWSMEQAEPQIRIDGIAGLADTPLAFEPEYRGVLEKLTNDPSPKVAAMAKLKIGQVDAAAARDRARTTKGPS